MFQSLRPNSQVYIFYKGDNPRLEKGFVVNSPIVRPKYTVPANFGQSSEKVVDLTIKIAGQNCNFSGLPAELDIADSYSNGESIVVSDNKEAMNAEILSLKQKSIDIVNSIEFHKSLITNCDTILTDLNPEFAEKKARDDEIKQLKDQMNDLTAQMSDLMAANRSLIEKLNK